MVPRTITLNDKYQFLEDFINKKMPGFRIAKASKDVYYPGQAFRIEGDQVTHNLYIDRNWIDDIQSHGELIAFLEKNNFVDYFSGTEDSHIKITKTGIDQKPWPTS